MKTTYLVLSPLDVLLASQIAGPDHHITTITDVGAACDRCQRLLNVEQWAGPCPGMPPAMLPSQPHSVGGAP